MHAIARRGEARLGSAALSVRRVSITTTSTMAKKSARALAAAEASRTPPPEAPSKVSVSDLSAKSCLTCGRVITPRAKWASDWSSIKYCSDRCRSSRPGKVVARFERTNKHAALARYDGCTVKDEDMHVDIEQWVEAVLLDVASQSTKETTLEDVQHRITDLLRQADVQRGESTDDKKGRSDEEDGGAEKGGQNAHALWKAIDSPPGLKERIRRAARRLALGITHDSDPAQTNITTTEAGRIELLQAGKTLRTVEDLSYAKGTLTVHRKS